MKNIILIVLNNFKNDSRVLKESISLQNKGYNVRVIALWENGLEEFEKIQNIQVHRLRLKSKNLSNNKLIQLLKYFEFIYKVINKYKYVDIIHCNDLDTLPIGVIIKRFFNNKIKIIYDAHEYEINDKPNEGKYSIKLKYFLEKFLIKYADKVITVSESIAKEYKKLYPFIEKPALVLNTPLYKEIEKKDLFREELGIDKEKTIFLYQGGLSKGRGIEILLETFKETDDNAVIVFMGYGPLEDMVKDASKKYNNIYFHPAVSPEILLDYTSSADFGILFYENNCLNHYYCSPNKMFEYLMAEIPVIVSNLYEMKRLVEKYKVGVVAKENTPYGLKEAIQKALILDKNELKENIKKAKKIFNWENQEKVLLNVYKELIR